MSCKEYCLHLAQSTQKEREECGGSVHGGWSAHLPSPSSSGCHPGADLVLWVLSSGERNLCYSPTQNLSPARHESPEETPSPVTLCRLLGACCSCPRVRVEGAGMRTSWSGGLVSPFPGTSGGWCGSLEYLCLQICPCPENIPMLLYMAKGTSPL